MMTNMQILSLLFIILYYSSNVYILFRCHTDLVTDIPVSK